MEKPIIFSAPMVKAILEGKKTQTRRVIKPQPDHSYDYYLGGWECWTKGPCALCGDENGKVHHPWQPGDILWVRETWAKISDWTNVDPDVGMRDGYIYKADWHDNAEHPKWRPSIHMPKEAARIFLLVKSVKTERLQDITEEDARAEGMLAPGIREYLLDSTSEKWCKYTVLAAKLQGRERPFTTDCIGGFALFWDSLNGKRGYPFEANPWVWVISFEEIRSEQC